MKVLWTALSSLLFGKPRDTISRIQYWILIVFVVGFCSIILMAEAFLLPHLVYRFGYLGALARSSLGLLVSLIGALMIAQVLRFISWWLGLSSRLLLRLSGH